MTHIKVYYILLILGVLLMCGCAKEVFDDYPINGDTNTESIIEFGYKPYDKVTISTKSTLSDDAEDRLSNLYIIIFDSTGKRVYHQYLDNSNRVLNLEDLADLKYGWYLFPFGEEEEEVALGRVKVNSPNVTGGKLYIICNLDEDHMNLSKNNLDIITSENSLNQFICRFITPTTYRLGDLLTLGYTSVNVSGNVITLGNGDIGTYGPIVEGSTHNALRCPTLDAKVSFNVGIVPGSVKVSHENGKTIRRTITGFIPESWQVFNLPTTSTLIPHQESVSPTEDFFNSELHIFEKTEFDVPCDGYDPSGNIIASTRNIYGFSFYMLENKQVPKSSVITQTKYSDINPYHLRDKRNKNSEGQYDTSSDKWEFAPEHATYVVIKGDISLDVTITDDITNATTVENMDANVVYYIHLGDFGDSEGSNSGFDNYTVNRNVHYTYNIDLKGVNSIDYEVLQDQDGFNKNNEKQSGSEGELTTSYETIYEFDSHYSQRVFKFNYNQLKSNVDVGMLTWSVTTPFGRNGVPDRVGPNKIEVPNGLDYKWVHFLVNTKNEYYEEPNSVQGTIHNDEYPLGSQKNRMWPVGGKENNELMNVIELCTFLREQVRLKENNEESAFDAEGNIYVTTFVDEYYYETDPISREYRSSLWKEFANKPHRVMHIMCSAAYSVDGSSSVINSALTIRQHSIQTIYNFGNAINGWGCENNDETKDKLWFFSRKEYRNGFGNRNHAENDSLRNDAHSPNNKNGLFNSGKLWGLVTGGPTTATGTEKGTFISRPWNNYLDFTRKNDFIASDGVPIGFMKDNDTIATLRYACLMRNRDENGNGYIDPEEIKWYMASTEQLQELYVGEMALSAGARLYSTENIRNTTSGIPNNQYYTWRNHVISSTAVHPQNKTKYLPEYIWAEEGISTSDYGNEYGKNGAYSIRCVRNLPRDGSKVYDVTDPEDMPERPINMTKNSDNTYTFDLSRVNDESKRIYTSHMLVPLDENGISARPYNKFQTGPLADRTFTGNEYTLLKESLLNGIQICPTGYRVPNIREMVIIYTFVKDDNSFWTSNNTHHMVANYYSFGILGDHPFDPYTDNDTNKPNYSWFFTKNRVTITPTGNCKIRCVRDVN